MLKIAICDDNILITTEIESLLEVIKHRENIHLDIDIYFDGSSLVEKISSGITYDLIYMDIEMENLDGIQAAHLIRSLQLPTLLIYVSAYDTYYKQLFEVEPFRFLSKPIDNKLFDKYFMAAYKKLNTHKQFFTFTFNQRTHKVPLSNIIYFESKGRNILIKTLDHEYRFLGKLSMIEDFIYDNHLNFLRIHQSYIINPHYICSICLSEITLYDNITLQISNKYQERIREQYLYIAEDL